jgi:Lipid A core - O-antigen ligase and related enzymes
MQQPTRHGTLLDVYGTDLKYLDKVSNHRLPLWEAAARVSLDHWINGIGPRGFRYVYDDYRPKEGKYDWEFKNGSTHPHFALLEISAETGLIGLAGIFILMFLLFKQLNSLTDVQKLYILPWYLGAVIAIVPNIAKAFYSSFWLSMILCMVFIGIANVADEYTR